MKAPTFGELAAAGGSGVSRRVARIEEALGTNRRASHVGLNFVTGVTHVGRGRTCAECPPLGQRTIARVTRSLFVVTPLLPQETQ